ncbi:MAG: ATP-binding protein [Chloroflexi bacterium]|nr:ATP-binding protein [Chloroflexota bacterium]MCI0785714.1 ATP-binding protein [Chloroflexota bacterium]MCI0824289.1 ATP-binding protein [Chloroflexota bacterium]MCI0859676.1 ATP-binding protein [Chloroflexota bacterium]MCI0865315.1 ATP-binding protein [Chloroflexota bacterium]
MTDGFKLDGETPGPQSGAPLGLVVDGSLSQGVEVRLDADVSVEDVKVGTFVTIQGHNNRFFGVVTDVSLGSTDPRLKHSPPQVDDPFIAQVLSGTVAYGSISVLPNLVMPQVLGDNDAKPVAAKTIPPHFSRAQMASEQDVAAVFGQEDQRHFWIGNPLEMEHKLCLDLDELVKRSIGVFGKSGTGKTFLTRLLLVGILQRNQASVLIFDMHSEYGWQGQDTDRNRNVKGLKQLFPSQVATFTLDEASARRRGVSTDEVVRIGYSEIEPEDVELLRETLNLSDVAASAAFNLQQHFGPREWLQRFLELQGPAVNELATEIQVHPSALGSLHNRLSRLKRFDFLVEKSGHDAANRMIEHLDRGKHVVLEFGRYGRDLTAYMLVSNLLTRRIHNRYVDRMEEAEGGQGRSPRPLVIVIEEAHKFLSPAVASHTIFGIIARELRKYNVTLMVIDQRPSAIDSEVMSQLGTRLTCLLDNDRDIEAVLSGTPGSRQLRTVLARLEAKQQALIFGHALPMPVVVRIREYGSPESYAQFSQSADALPAQEAETPAEQLEREISELF